MAEWSYEAITGLICPGGTIAFHGAGDTIVLDPSQCRGLGAFQARQPRDPHGQTSGEILHPSFLPGADILLVGRFHITSVGTFPGYTTARDALMDTTYARAKSGVGTSTCTLTFAGGGSIGGLKVQMYEPVFIAGPLKGCHIHVVGSDLP